MKTKKDPVHAQGNLREYTFKQTFIVSFHQGDNLGKRYMLYIKALSHKNHEAIVPF